MNDIPVLILTFNRPEQTLRQLQNLELIKPRNIFFAQDGPRPDRKDEEEKCRLVSEIIHTPLTWKADVNYLERNQNLGCKAAVTQAISWFFTHVEAGIILEDDCLVSVEFFELCDELLTKYKDQSDISMIAALNPLQKASNFTYFPSRHALIWGWATWKDRWEQFDIKMEDFNVYQSKTTSKSISSNHLIGEYLLHKWTETFNGYNDSWAYAWAYHVFKSNGRCLIPGSNQVNNIGIGVASTHTSFRFGGLDKLRIGQLQRPFQHPKDLESTDFDNAIFYKSHKSRWLLVANKLFPKRLIQLLRPIYLRLFH